MSATLRLFFSIFEEDLHYFQELFKLLFEFDMSIILVKKSWPDRFSVSRN